MLRIALFCLTISCTTAILANEYQFNSSLDTTALPDFKLRWRNHASDDTTLWKSGDYNDAVYVIEAYFKNCPACNENAPNVNKLADFFSSDEKVKVLDVSRDCKDSYYKIWIERHQPNHPVLDDCAEKEQQVLSPLNVVYYPTTIILDCKLNEVFRTVGTWNNAVYNQIKNKIKSELDKNCTR